MKIVFIRLNMFEHISSDAMKPILFAIIRELTPQTHEIEFLDERAEPLPERIDADLIAFSVETYTAKRAYILAKRYKTPQNRIVMGGFHAAVMADEMLQYADTVLVGDAEGTWPQLLADCKNGCPKRKYISDETAEPLSPAPHPEIYRHRYAGIGVHQLSRGCKFNCDFCSIKTSTAVCGRKHRRLLPQNCVPQKKKSSSSQTTISSITGNPRLQCSVRSRRCEKNGRVRSVWTLHTTMPCLMK